jgi:hypothetical protein
MSDEVFRKPGELLDPSKGRLLCQEPRELVRRKKLINYIFGFSMTGLFFVMTFWALISGTPQAIIIALVIAGPGVLIVVWTKFLLPVTLYDNGIEWGFDFPSILGDTVIFLSWGELGRFTEFKGYYFFSDSLDHKKAIIRKSWPGAKEAVEIIKERINIVEK